MATAPTAVFDAYDAVIADLRAKRDAIDNLIAGLEAARAGGTAPASPLAPVTNQNGGGSIEEPGAFLGLSIPDATKKLLAAKKRPMNNAEIAQALKAGGMMMSSADPNNTIGSIVTRRANQIGDIVKVDRGVWGLREWYPTRQFKTPGKAGAEPKPASEPSEPSAPAQPSEQPQTVPRGIDDLDV